ncbi:MAG: AMP-binding protein [Candidatus Dormibacteria bacterium]
MTRQGGRAPIRERDMVAALLPPGEALVNLLGTCWEAGAALLPLDPRTPPRLREQLLAAAAPTLLVDAAGASRRRGREAASGDALVIASSGTAGTPRLVVLQRQALEAAVRASASRLGLSGTEPWLLSIPPWHIGGMLVLLRHHLLGAPLVLGEGADLPASLGDPGVRCVSLVPTQVHRLVAAGARLDHLDVALVGGDALDDGLRARAAALGIPVVHTYGQSQSGGGVVYDGVALDGVSVAVSAGGEVLLGGPTRMRGYRNDDAASAAAFDEVGRLRTGDAGVIDEAGRLAVSGRLDDVIVSGGEKVVPGDVERVLRGLAGVADVAVIGEPDAEWGHRVVAVVGAAPGGPPALARLRDAARESLPAAALPARLVTVESLPRTPSGKLRRAEIRARLAGPRRSWRPRVIRPEHGHAQP